jgi:UDP-GlcNAc:undecaprenyl-phosphate/decaprenyl-phosphate GlcNAc-1-phosphate transferase
MMEQLAEIEATGLTVVAAVAAVSAAIGTVFARRLAHAIGMVSHPNPIVPQHTRSIAYLGGVGVAFGIMVAIMFMWWSSRLDGPTIDIGSWSAVLGCSMAFLLLGIMDDRRAFGAVSKFALQAIIAGVAVSLGMRVPMFGVPPLDWLASWFWICMLVNAFNFVDVSDGLLTSVAAIVFIAIAVAFPHTAPLAVPAAAACLGFLPFNRPPASIFLGDAGSHLLGFIAAALTIIGVRDCPSPVAGWVVSATILIVPLFELVFITVVRIRKGIPWWKGSPDHFALRLQTAGFDRPAVIAIAAGVTVTAATVAVVALRISPIATIIAMALVCCGMIPCWRYLIRMK